MSFTLTLFTLRSSPHVTQVAAGAKFEQEIKQEQERKKKEAAEAAERRAAFKEKAAMFQ